MPTAGATIGSNAKLRSQYKTLYKFAKKLKVLSQADNAQAYSDALTWSRTLSESILDMVSHYTAEELSEQLINCKLCESLYCAVSQGLQHLATDWDQLGTAAHPADDSGAIRSLCILCQELVTVSNALERAGGDTRVNQTAIASETGFLQSMRPVLCKLLPALEPLQYSAPTSNGPPGQQQLTSAEQSVHVSLAASLLQMWAMLLILWPGDRIKSSEFSTTIQPAASLALALMRIPPPAARFNHSAEVAAANCADLGGNKSSEHAGTADCHSSNSSTRCGSQSSLEANSGLRQRDWCSVGLFLAHTITVAVHHQLDREAHDHYRDLSQDLQDVVLSGGVQQLMLVSLAAAAAAAERSGSTAATQQEAQDRGSTTLGYKSLLSLIGLQSDCLQGLPAVSDSVLQLFGGDKFDMCYLTNAITCTFSLHIEVQQGRQQQQHTAVDRAAASNVQHQNISSAAAPHLQQLAWPLLTTLKDLAVLLSDPCQYEQVLEVLLPCACVVSKQSTDGVPWLDAKQQQQVLQWLLQPLYLRVAAAVTKPQCHTAAAAAASAAASKARPSERHKELMSCWWRVTSCFLHQADSAEVVCIDSQLIRLDGDLDRDSGHSVAAIEAFVRWSSSNKLDGKTIWAEGLLVGEALLGSLEDMATKEALSPNSSDLQRWLAKPAAHQQLLALFCSLLKLTASHAADCQQLRGFMTQVLKLYRKQQLQHTVACSSSSAVPRQRPGVATATCVPGQHQVGSTDTTGRLSTSSYRHWAALAGRVMLAEAQEMQQHARTEITAVAEVTQKWLKVGRLLWKSKLFGKQSDKMKKNFKWLQLNLKQADRGIKEGEWAVSHRGGDLSEFLRLLKTHGPQIMQTGVPNDALQDSLQRQLLLQLQRCGSAVCAAFPVKFCCNNPACVNLAKLSEQMLVAGKGSRCSGCKVARYCSRECQLKHWKPHKRTCKRIRAQRTARPSSNAVPGPV